MHPLRERFFNVCDDFLSAVASGGQALQAFDDEWSDLASAVNEAMEAGHLDDETISLACEASNRLAIYASAFHDLGIDYQELTSDLMEELGLALGRLTLSDDPTPTICTAHHPRISPAAKQTVRTRLFDEMCGIEPFEHAAYSWLIDNLHNPYPSKVVRETIARSSKVDTTVVSKWFASFRAQIGWNHIRDQTFDGSRKQTIRAASRVFGQTDCSELSDTIVNAFKDMRTAALSSLESLYRIHEKTLGTQAAADLNLDKTQHCRQLPVIESHGWPYSSRTASSSSSCSSSSSPSSSSSSSSSCRDMDLPRPQSSTVHKRCRSLADSDDDDELRSPEGRATKRLRSADFTHDNVVLLTDKCRRDVSSTPLVAVRHATSPVDSRSTSFFSRPPTSAMPKSTEGICLKSATKRQRENDGEEVNPMKRPRAEKEEVDALSSDWFKTHSASILKSEDQSSLAIEASFDIQVFSDWSSLTSTDEMLPMAASSAIPHEEVPAKAEAGGGFVSVPNDDVQNTTDASVDELVRALLNGPSYTQELSCVVDAVPPSQDTSLPLLSSHWDVSLSTDILPQIDNDSWLFPQGIPEAPDLTSQWGTPDADATYPHIHAGLCPAMPQHNEGDILGTPPPSFEESFGNFTSFGLDSYTSNHPYDITTTPPPPYQILENPGDLLYDIFWGKTNPLDFSTMDAPATTDMTFVEPQSLDTSHLACLWA